MENEVPMRATDPADGTPRRQSPHLRKHGSATQLVVDGKPFLIAGGELHNSSSSSLAYMQSIWERLLDSQINTVLAAVSWELVEPAEGRFEFALVDRLLQDARRRDLRLILLWFGSWKNGVSSYIPGWVKQDTQRYPRAKRRNGKSMEVLSTLAEANWEADARAFAALMAHLREVDGAHHTVIMVQVENEVGVLGDSRDHSPMANSTFDGPVPGELIEQLTQHRHELHAGLRRRWEEHGFKPAGSWEAVFGGGAETDELFMAWHYARYIDQVAAAGKAAYDLPMFVNAWLNAVVTQQGLPAGGKSPGDWPSGGPLPHTLDIWLAGAPHIDVLCPDIYFGDFQVWCRDYTRRGNPLFIPEMRRDAEGARHVFYAIGQHDALGTSPFGIDSLDEPVGTPISVSYALLRQLAPLILEHQGMSATAGFVLDAEHPRTTRALGGYELEITLDQGFGFQVEHGYGLIVVTAPGTFVGAGFGFRVSFRPLAPGTALAGILAVDEGEYRDGEWVANRRLNGDETGGGQWWRFPVAGKGTGIIATLGAGTGISHCKVYRYE